jgi:uncharacterized protein HemX
MDVPKSRWLDSTINVQSLFFAVIAAAGGAVVMWYTLVGRVSTLEEHDRQQEAHFSQIERAVDQQRNDLNQRLRDIGQDVKDTNKKLDDLTQQLLLGSAGNRPETKRWAR